MLELLIELVEHSDEDNYDCKPLIIVDVVFEDEDADDDCEDFTGCGDEGEYMLFEV